VETRVLPDEYKALAEAEVEERVREIKAQLGSSLVILGHHYQRDEVNQFADFRGDSLQLARLAASERNAKFIVFCGVHFMAETAAMLTRGRARVMMPDSAAGCPMADMAEATQVQRAWEALTTILGDSIAPITYINSHATLKDFCGRHGGTACTSSNAKEALRWGLKKRQRAFFFPDEHLGTNTAEALGIELPQVVVWDPDAELGGTSEERLRAAKAIVWKGYCHVHTHFTTDQILALKAKHPAMRFVVHPECKREVVQMADLAGSTGFIIRTIKESPAGSQWGVGTEVNLVNRLNKEHPDKLVLPLTSSLCGTMYLTNTRNLLWVLESIVEGNYVNTITVPGEVTTGAMQALETMLTITAT